MKLKIRDMDIATGGILIAIVNESDARKLDLHHADRVRLKKGSRKVVAIIDIAESKKPVPPGVIGLFEEVLDRLGVNDGDIVDMELEKKPVSISFIKKKLDGKELNYKEIYAIIEDVAEGRLTDIELTYYVAGNYAFGMTLKEIVSLTRAMINTGDQIKLDKKVVVDKHCIGGVPGNRTTPIVVAILSAAGLTVPKTSSRAITSPAGTADTIEVIAPVAHPVEKIKDIIKKTGGCMVWGGAVNLAPADDTIINVEHPLSIDAEGQLLASIMAKKGSVSATHVLIDIPIGKGSKIENKKEALHLKKWFENIGKELGMKIKVIVTDGSQPIGNGVGPALEARDLLKVLNDDEDQPMDLRKKCINIAGEMLELAGRSKVGEGRKLAKEILDSGRAYKKFWEIMKAQGGKIVKPQDIEVGKFTYDYLAPKSGRIIHIDDRSISKIARVAGCPRDKVAGVYLYKHKLDSVKKGEKIFTIYSKNNVKLGYAKEFMKIVDGIIIR